MVPYGVDEFDLGLFQTASGPLYVNPGIGWYPVPLRFNCRPEIAVIEIAVNTNCSQNCMRSASGAVNIKPAGDNAIDYVLNLLVGCSFLHDNDHLIDLNFSVSGVRYF